MTKKQLMALMQIIKGVNTLRSTYTDNNFVQLKIPEEPITGYRLVIDAPFKESAWALSLIIDANSTINCEINNTKITFE